MRLERGGGGGGGPVASFWLFAAASRCWRGAGSSVRPAPAAAHAPRNRLLGTQLLVSHGCGTRQRCSPLGGREKSAYKRIATRLLCTTGVNDALAKRCLKTMIFSISRCVEESAAAREVALRRHARWR